MIPKAPSATKIYVGALVEFENGARGTFEASRSIFGPKNQMAFELNGTQGALNWDFERMNELELYLPDDDWGPRWLYPAGGRRQIPLPWQL